MENKPAFCCLSITDRCMLQCRMCFKWQDAVWEESPTLIQYKNFIANLRELADDNFKIYFGGGEVLLFDGLLDLVKFSSNKGFLTLVASNGWLIDEQMAKRITDSGLTEIAISLDSLNEDTHDYLRGRPGVYCRVMDAIGYLKKYSQNIKIGINSVICDYNLDDLASLLEWAGNNDKINSIFFLVITQPDNTEMEEQWWKGKYGYLWPKDTAKACSFIDQLIKIKSTGHKIGNTLPQLEAFKLYLQHPERFVKKTDCDLGRMFHVNAVGDISFLCSQSGILGNIKNGDNLKEIWFSERSDYVRKKIESSKKNCRKLINCFFGDDSAIV